MIFYCIHIEGKIIGWVGEKSKAEAIAKAAESATFTEIEVPTDKPNLLLWLQTNVLGENRVKQIAERFHPK